MKYLTKVILRGRELTSETSKGAYIADAVFSDVVSSSALELGATGANGLAFTIVNPIQSSYDGEKVEFYVSPIEDAHVPIIDQLINEVGEEEDSEVVIGYDDEITGTDEEEEEDTGDDGEELTPDEEATSSEEIEEEVQAVYENFEGSSETVTTETTAEETEEEWIKIGTFKVYKQASTGGEIRLICYDNFALMNDTFTPAVRTDTIANLYADYCNQLSEKGISVDTEHSMPTGTITWDMDFSFRESIGYFAGLCGGYATFDQDGELCINQYSNGEAMLIKDELIDCTGTSGGDIAVTGFACNGLVSGDIASITFKNPYMNQEILDDIYASYQGYRLSGQRFTAMWRPNLQAGTIIKLLADEDEAAGYIKLRNYVMNHESDTEAMANLNSVGKNVQITSLTVVFIGDAVATVNSELPTVTAIENPIVTPIKDLATFARAAARAAAGMANGASEMAGNALDQVLGLDISGRNLFIGAGDFTEQNPAENDTTASDGYRYITSITANVIAGEKYMLQCCSDGIWSSVHQGGRGGDYVTFWLTNPSHSWHKCFYGDDETTGRYVWEWTAQYTETITIRVNCYGAPHNFWDFKIERGNKATGWTPAPEDVNVGISEAYSLAQGASEYIEDISETIINIADYEGFIEIDEEPSISLGRKDVNGNQAWSTKISDNGVTLNRSADVVGEFGYNPNKNESYMKANVIYESNVKYRSANGEGNLGLVAGSGGHVKLKVV